MLGTRSSRPLTLLAASVLAVGVTATAGAAARPSAGTGRTAAHPDAGQAGCTLGAGGKIQHVIYMMFDNTHYTRDNPNVPSDLQQMPNLLNFLTGNGTLITHEHTPLIAHTADDSVTLESGLYGADQGIPIANEYNYYQPDGTTHTAGSFAYWTDPIVDYDTGLAAKPVGDSTTTMLGTDGKTAGPVGRLHQGGLQLRHGRQREHRTGEHPPRCAARVRRELAGGQGGGEPEPAEQGDGGLHGAGRALRTGFRGLRRRVAAGPLRQPGGYHGYRALYGSKFIQPVISPGGPVRNLGGQIIKDSSGDIGFPGYDGMTGVNWLAPSTWACGPGLPVTFTYLSDLHDNFNGSGPFGPGQAGYTAQLRQENAAFGTFFARLAAHGITKANTLFVFTSDEGDHFVGSAPSPAGCTGVTVPCHYSNIGEVNGNLTRISPPRASPRRSTSRPTPRPASTYTGSRGGRARRCARWSRPRPS